MYDPKIHRRRSHRWRGYDYSKPGAYFVTGCERFKRHVFGQVVEGEMHLSPMAEIVAACWKWLAKGYPYVVLDEWIVMPNHIHGIIILTDVGAVREPPLQIGGARDIGAFRDPSPEGFGPHGEAPLRRKSLGRLIGAFKTASTNDINALQHTGGPTVWQRDFYDRVIRDDDELEKIREYIRTNPLKWDSDPENVQGRFAKNPCSLSHTS